MVAAPQRTIRGYELRDLIGKGGFGEVYRAYQTAVDREVAIKLILPHHANQPEFIRNFETEARVVARLEHPHIVPLFDFWRDPDGAYLVMRFLRGGSLRDLLDDDGALSHERAARLIEQISEALAVSHRNDVIHRDIKPQNILLDEDGNAYLSDFGVAKVIKPGQRDTEAEDYTGSPHYAAPEQIQSGIVTPQTDIYALGLVIYELLVGKHAFQVSSLSEILVAQLEQTVPDIRLERPELSEALNDMLQYATAKDPALRYRDVRQLAADLKRELVGESALAAAAPDSGVILIVDNPYKGLRPFEQVDASDFYGREELVAQIVKRLGQSRFLAVVGPSGSGKSSVVKAGVLPQLRTGGLKGSENWFIAEMLPGSQPLKNLENLLLGLAVKPPAHLSDQLRSDPRGLLWAADRVLGDLDSDLVIVIDQFEELFTQVEDEAVRAHFLDLVRIVCTDPESRVRVIVTLRADLYDRPLLYEQFGALMQANTQVVLPLSAEETKRAIAAPAERVGLQVDANLIAAAVGDLRQEPGALPLLQYAMTEVFERRDGNILTLEAYQDIGGVTGALARRAEEVYSSLLPSDQSLAQQLFLRLITPGEGTEDSRRRATRSELNALGTADGVAGLLDTFGQYRLLTFDRDVQTREPTIEIAHEALIREWLRLRDWLTQSRDDLRMQRALAAAAAEWQTADRDVSFLLTGSRLTQFEDWARASKLVLTGAEQDFLIASSAERERQAVEEAARQAQQQALERRSRNFLRALVVVLLVATVGALVLSSIAVTERDRAQTSAATATVAQGEALNQAELALNNAATATIAQGEALNQAELALNNAATATIAQGEALNQARIAFNNAATATIAQGEALDQAELALNNAATATNAQGEAESARATSDANAQLAATQAALAEGNAATAQANLLVSEGLRLAAEANAVINNLAGDPQLAALLSIRAALTSFSPQAEMALTQATLLRGYPVQLYDHGGSVVQVAVSTEAGLVATGGTDSVTRVWELASGELLYELEIDSGLDNPFGVPEELIFSPDGRYLGVVGIVDPGGLFLWDMRDGSLAYGFFRHNGNMLSAAFSPDGSLLATGGADSLVRVWDVSTGLERIRIAGHTGDVLAVAFVPDGSQILSGSSDGSARLWDAATGEEVRTLLTGDTPVTSVAVADSGEFVVTSAELTTLWDVEDGDEDDIERFRPSMSHVAVSPDSRLLMIAESRPDVGIYDLETDERLRRLVGHSLPVPVAVFSRDNRFALTGGQDGIARLWDIGGAGLAGRRLTGFVQSVADLRFLPDGEAVVVTDANNVHLRDLFTDTTLREFSGHTNPIEALDLSPDGRLLLTGSRDNTARLWSVETGAELHLFAAHTDAVRAVDLSPDGTQAMTGSNDGSVWLWDAGTGQEIRRFVHPGGPVFGVAYSPDGTRGLVTGADATAVLWDTETGERLRTFGEVKSVDSASFGLAFTPDGQTVIIGDLNGVITLYDVETGAQTGQFTAHTDAIISVNVSANGRWLVSASSDNTARLWDLETGETLRQFTAHTDGLNQVMFSPDERMIASVGKDGVVWLWDVDWRDTVDHLCSRLIRDFTQPERQLYNLTDDEPTCTDPPGTRVFAALSVGAAEVEPMSPPPAPRALRGHSDQVWSKAITADGAQIVSASFDGTLRVWDVETGQELRTIVSYPGNVVDMALAPDGQRVWTFSDGGPASLWDVQTGDLIREYPGVVIGILPDFAPDGQSLAYVSLDRVARVIDVETGSERHVLQVPGHEIYALAYSPDGRTIATGGTDGFLRLWDAATGVEQQSIRAHEDTIFSLAWSPDGQQLLTGNGDFNLVNQAAGVGRLWDVGTGQLVRAFAGHASSINYAAFSPDGRYIVTGSPDLTTRLWDVATGRQLTEFAPTATYDILVDVTFSKDGRYFVGSDTTGTIWVWNVERLLAAERSPLPTATPLPTLTPAATATPMQTSAPVTAATPNPAGTAQMGENRGMLNAGGTDIWAYDGTAGTLVTLRVISDQPANGASMEERAAAALLDPVLTVRTPDGRELASADDAVLSLRTDPIIYNLQLPTTGRYELVINGWDDLSRGGYTLVLEPPTLVPALTLTERYTNDDLGTIFGISLSPDGRYLTASIVGERNVNTLLLDAETGDVVREFPLTVRDSAFTPDGRQLVLSGFDPLFVDVETGEVQTRLIGHEGNTASLALSADGAWLASSDVEGVVYVWDVETGSISRELTGAVGTIMQVGISADGRYALAITQQSLPITYVWDAQTGDLLIETPGISGTFAPDGQRVYIGAEGIQVYELPSGQIVSRFIDDVIPTALVISVDGDHLIAGTSLEGIYIMNRVTGEVLDTVPFTAGSIDLMALSTDLRYLAATTDEGGLRVWQVEQASAP